MKKGKKIATIIFWLLVLVFFVCTLIFAISQVEYGKQKISKKLKVSSKVTDVNNKF